MIRYQIGTNIIFSQYPSKNVFVMGFSQGAAVCYEYVMGIKKSLGGIFPVAGFLWKDSNKKNRLSKENKNAKILIGHGTSDDVIPIEKSLIAYKILLNENANVEMYKYNSGHKVSMNYIRRMMEIINGCS